MCNMSGFSLHVKSFQDMRLRAVFSPLNLQNRMPLQYTAQQAIWINSNSPGWPKAIFLFGTAKQDATRIYSSAGLYKHLKAFRARFHCTYLFCMLAWRRRKSKKTTNIFCLNLFFWIEPSAFCKVPLLYTSGLWKKKHFILFTWSKNII